MNNKKFHKIRTGVIGVGSMGQNHARVYKEISNLVGVFDKNIVQGEKVASRLNIPFYSRIEDLLEKVDAVSIAVPTFLHLEVSKKVASFGVDMLVEKPLAMNVQESKEIIDIANNAGVKLAVGHIERHNPVIRYAKSAIDRGEWGKIISLSSKRVSSYPERIKDVGVVFDLGIHDLDILSYLVGAEISSVYGVGGSVKLKENEDFVSITLQFKNGNVGYCEINWLTPMKVRQLNINCTSSYVEIDYINQSVKQFSSEFLNLDESNLYSTELDIKTKDADIRKEEPLKLELLDFLNSIEYKTQPLVSGEDGLKAVILAKSVLDSLKKHKKINI